MTLMYFRTLDGRLGVVAREGDGWRCRLATTPAEREQLAALFEALDKHIRQGFFLLPNPLASQPAGAAAPAQEAR